MSSNVFSVEIMFVFFRQRFQGVYDVVQIHSTSKLHRRRSLANRQSCHLFHINVGNIRTILIVDTCCLKIRAYLEIKKIILRYKTICHWPSMSLLSLSPQLSDSHPQLRCEFLYLRFLKSAN